MTVAELIEKLKEMPQSAQVILESDYGIPYFPERVVIVTPETLSLPPTPEENAQTPILGEVVIQ